MAIAEPRSRSGTSAIASGMNEGDCSDSPPARRIAPTNAPLGSCQNASTRVAPKVSNNAPVPARIGPMRSGTCPATRRTTTIVPDAAMRQRGPRGADLVLASDSGDTVFHLIEVEKLRQ